MKHNPATILYYIISSLLFSAALESANMAFSAAAVKVRIDAVILFEPALWDQWFEDTKASVPSQMWKYFDPDNDAALTEPVEPIMPVDKPPPAGNKPPQAQNARVSRNQRLKDVYFKLFGVFKENERKWDRYHKIDAKLRERI